MKLISKRKNKYYLYSHADYSHTDTPYPSAIINPHEGICIVEGVEYFFENIDAILIYAWEIYLDFKTHQRFGLAILQANDAPAINKSIKEGQSLLVSTEDSSILKSKHRKIKSGILNNIENNVNILFENAIHIYDDINKESIYKIISKLFSIHTFFVFDIADTVSVISLSNRLENKIELENEKAKLESELRSFKVFNIETEEKSGTLEILIQKGNEDKKITSAMEILIRRGQMPKKKSESQLLEFSDSRITYQREGNVKTALLEDLKKIVIKTAGDFSGIHLFFKGTTIHIDLRYNDVIYPEILDELESVSDCLMNIISLYFVKVDDNIIDIETIDYYNDTEVAKYKYLHTDSDKIQTTMLENCSEYFHLEDRISMGHSYYYIRSKKKHYPECNYSKRNFISHNSLMITMDLKYHLCKYSHGDYKFYIIKLHFRDNVLKYEINSNSGRCNEAVNLWNIEKIIIHKGKIKGISILTHEIVFFIETFYTEASRWLTHRLRNVFYLFDNTAIPFEENLSVPQKN